MTDDLVARLRVSAGPHSYHGSEWKRVFLVFQELCGAAADEIERLRAERDALPQDAECWRQFKRDCEKAQLALESVVGEKLAAVDAAREGK